MPITPVYSKTFIIPESVIDENGHVNNVAYVQWMQDTAIGGTSPLQKAGATWAA